MPSNGSNWKWEDNKIMETHGDNQLIRCPNGHILGAFDAHGVLRVKHKGRLVTLRTDHAEIEVVCEQCGRTSRFLLDGQAIHAH